MKAWITLLLVAVVQTPVAQAAKPGNVDGKSLFAAKCALCHGQDAKGKPAMAKMFKADPADLDLTGSGAQKKSDAALTQIIANGKNKMPAFKGKLQDAEIAGIVSYVRSLAPAQNGKK